MNYMHVFICLYTIYKEKHTLYITDIRRRQGQEIFLLTAIFITVILIIFSNYVPLFKTANLTDIFRYIRRSIPTLERTKPSKVVAVVHIL